MTKTESILAEATLLAAEHPSKDVRYFAESVNGLCAENAELRRLIKDVAIPAMQSGARNAVDDFVAAGISQSIETLQEAVKCQS